MAVQKYTPDDLFSIVEELYWTLPGPDNRWPTSQQKKRLYERATIKVLLKRLDDSYDHNITLKMLHDGLLEVENVNPNAPGIRIALQVLQDLMVKENNNYD